MNLILLGFIAALTSGCFSVSKENPELIPKLEETKSQYDLGRGTYLFRIFGIDQPFLALYNPRTKELSHIYKARISDKGGDFWQRVKEDMRMTRESRYFAISSALSPNAFLSDSGTAKVSGSFRADIFRGDPAKTSNVGRNILFSVVEVVFPTKTKPAKATTHIFIGGDGEFHAIPLNAQSDLLSFDIVDGLQRNSLHDQWLAVHIESDGSMPASTNMGCVSNYSGKILAGTTTEETEISAICVRQGRAGPN